MASAASFSGPGNEDPEQALYRIFTVATPGPEDMLFAAQRQTTRIVSRTEQGRDVNGGQFAEYSPAYAKKRERAGRNTSPVDLTFSGRMLASLSPEVIGEAEFAITVRDPDAAVYGRALNDGNDRLPQRRWFDTSREELQEMAHDLGESMQARLRSGH